MFFALLLALLHSETTPAPTPTLDTSGYAWRYAVGALIALAFFAGIGFLLYYVIRHPEFFRNDYAELTSHEDHSV